MRKHVNIKKGRYSKIVAIKEMSAGNDIVGDMWLETKSFAKSAPVGAIIDWAKDAGGKLIITVDESTIYEENSENQKDDFYGKG